VFEVHEKHGMEKARPSASKGNESKADDGSYAIEMGSKNGEVSTREGSRSLLSTRRKVTWSCK
jgi:hypothetical protein